MAKKKTGMLVVTIILVLVLLGIIGFFVYHFVPSAQTILPQSQYTCQAGYYCAVTPILDCTTPSSEERVIFRTNAITEQDLFGGGGSGTWIAVDKFDANQLRKYVAISSTVSPCPGSNPSITNGGVVVKSQFYNTIYNKGSYFGKERVMICDGTTGRIYEERDTNIPAEISITPQTPYSTNGQEVYSGDLYSCTRTLFKNNNQIGVLNYAGTSPTPSNGKRGNTYQLAGGDTFKADGTGVVRLDVASSQVPITTCVVTIAGQSVTINQGESVCLDVHTLASCDSPPQVTTEEKEDQLCVNGQWNNLYDITITIDATTVSIGENFIVNFDLDDPQYSPSGRVVYLYLKQNGAVVDSDNKITSSQGKVTLEVTPNYPGYYELIVEMAHPESDFSRTYSVQVSESLTVSTFRTISPQYDSDDIIAIVDVTKSGNPVAVYPNGEIQTEATYNGANKQPSGITTVGIGEYHIYWSNVQGDGDLRFRVKVKDPNSAYVTDWTQYKTIQVKRTGLRFTNIDFPDSKCNKMTHTARFTIEDSTGAKVTGATVSVQINNEDVNVDEQGNGVYSFSNYYAEGGNYNIEIYASKGGIIGSDNIPLNILSCSNPDPDPNPDWTFYIIIGIFILGAVAFVYFVFFFRRKR